MSQLPITAHPSSQKSGDGARPTVLILPGGGYEHLADHESEPVAEWLNAAGFHAFILRYRLAPHRFPAALEDAAEAMRYIRTGDHGVDIEPDHVGVLGFSAGGHLAASLPTADLPGSRPDFAVLCYPVISFVHEVNEGSARNLLGPDLTLEDRRRHSLEFRVSDQSPPTFLWHTADDEGVAVSNSLRYTDALVRHGVPVELHVFPHGRHGLGLLDEVPHVRQWTDLCERWLQTLD